PEADAPRAKQGGMVVSLPGPRHVRPFTRGPGPDVGYRRGVIPRSTSFRVRRGDGRGWKISGCRFGSVVNRRPMCARHVALQGVTSTRAPATACDGSYTTT